MPGRGEPPVRPEGGVTGVPGSGSHRSVWKGESPECLEGESPERLKGSRMSG